MPGAGAASEPAAEPASEPAGIVAEPMSEPPIGFAASFFLPQAANDIATTATTMNIFFMI